MSEFIENLNDIFLLENDIETLLAFLQDCKLLPCKLNCFKCGKLFDIILFQEKFVFRCVKRNNKNGCLFRKTCSGKGNWFANVKYAYTDYIYILRPDPLL